MSRYHRNYGFSFKNSPIGVYSPGPIAFPGSAPGGLILPSSCRFGCGCGGVLNCIPWWIWIVIVFGFFYYWRAKSFNGLRFSSW